MEEEKKPESFFAWVFMLLGGGVGGTWTVGLFLAIGLFWLNDLSKLFFFCFHSIFFQNGLVLH